MKDKYEITKENKGYGIRKIEDEKFSVKELKELLEVLIAEGKGEYSVYTEGFCCGTSWISIFDECKEISID
ncbi:MAG: hypothetical protein J6A89_04200 [Clostridia bacterium]|nr:hypothetical protein [Clostridia bacterium]